ncbi:acyl--CoA ligase [Permianibacter sp. IMCC34836]|uniref:class I adenylate-forming enzyme family protein n=1 Tax=Permianibacter fluminis TaxID=2738515 RepID=UPI0015559232|nr:class I adenylate-forming enzyme family protein [Permianibacter fluminis]NQD35550.1 acyl--CoA ligase [Permianibacter fluminis]
MSHSVPTHDRAALQNTASSSSRSLSSSVLADLFELAAFPHWPGFADRTVCRRANAAMTGADFLARVENVRARLSSTQLSSTPSQRWLLWCEDSFEFAVGLFALWQAGHGAVLPPNAQPETLAQLLPDCAGILSDHLPTAIPTQQTTTAAMVRPPQPITADALALQLFTSGSTGKPKAVHRTLRQLQAELQALSQQFPLPDATVLATVPHHHIYGLLFRLLWPLASGRCFVAETEHYPEPLLAQIATHAPCLLISSPAHLNRLPAATDLTRVAPALVATFSSGAPLSRDSALLLQQQWGAAPYEVLGSTETGGVAWRQRDAASSDERWQLLPSVQARLTADGGLQVLSPAAERQDWCDLGDRAVLRDARHFELLGRADRIVKIEAKRLSLTELEQALATHPAVAEVAALVLDSPRSIVAVVIRLTATGQQSLHEQGKRAVNEQLRNHLAGRFERVLLPKRFRYVADMPRDSRGKLTQQALTALFAADSHDGVPQ